MNYIILWKTKDAKKSASQFADHGHNTQAVINDLAGKGIEVVQSWHALGAGRGFIVAKVADIAALQTAEILLADVYDVEVLQVLTDEESARALAPFLKK